MNIEMLYDFFPLAAFAIGGVLFGVFLKMTEANKLRAEIKSAKSDIAVAEDKVRQQEHRNSELEREKKTLELAAKTKQESYEQQAAQLIVLREQLEKHFQAMAGEALKASQSSFLKLAQAQLQEQQQKATVDLDRRHKSLDELLQPLSEMLGRYEHKVTEIEHERQQAFGSITQQLQDVARIHARVRAETQKLTQAIKGTPRTRGGWTEQQLQNVLELAGMSEHVDFLSSGAPEADPESLQPDAIIRLPGGRQLVVDARTPTKTFFEGLGATGEAERERRFSEHATQFRDHMERLGSTAYWDRFEKAPDFVVMFVPGDHVFSAVAERDRTIFEDAVARRVLIATPTTLIALAKAIAFGWSQEKIADRAKAVTELGKEVCERLSQMGARVVDLGQQLDSSVKAYNGLVGDLENDVLPQARKFGELEDGAQLTQVETRVREPWEQPKSNGALSTGASHLPGMLG